MSLYRFPDFLIIGAMKAGTTSLFMDLSRHPQIYLQHSKEPHCLCEDHVFTDEGMRKYAQYYQGAKADQLICDASTGYAKLPDYPGVVPRAIKLLPPDFKVIYIIRHPIERIASQFHHERTAGLVDDDINEAVRKHPRYVNYSRYGYQLRPWVEAIGNDRILVLRLEEYKECRQAVVSAACEFLGLSTERLPSISDKVYNQSAGKPVARSYWATISTHWFYRRLIRPLLMPRIRLKLQSLVLPKSTVAPVQMSKETTAWLAKQLEGDVKLLEGLVGLNEPPLPY